MYYRQVDLHGGDALVPILFLITNGIEMYIYCYFANNITHTVRECHSHDVVTCEQNKRSETVSPNESDELSLFPFFSSTVRNHFGECLLR